MFLKIQINVIVAYKIILKHNKINAYHYKFVKKDNIQIKNKIYVDYVMLIFNVKHVKITIAVQHVLNFML